MGQMDWLQMTKVDIIMPDLQKVGGLREGQRIANLANLILYVFCAPHGSFFPGHHVDGIRSRRAA